MTSNSASSSGFAGFIDKIKLWSAPFVLVALFVFGLRKGFKEAQENISWAVLSVVSVALLFLFWVWTSKTEREVGDGIDQQLKIEKVPLYPRGRKWALSGMILLLILTPSGFAVAEYIKRRPSNKIIILIADFDGPDPQTYRVTQNIHDGLVKTTKEYPDLQVQLLDETITFKQGSNFARSKGEKGKASMVLWGSYGKTADSVQITVNFEVLTTPLYFSLKQQSISSKSCGDEAISKTLTSSIEELNKFILQVNLAQQLSALTLMTIGVAQFKAGNHDAALDRFTKALEHWDDPGEVIQAAQIYFWRANAYLAKGELDRAISDYDDSIQRQPGIASAYYNRGNAHNRKGDFDKAIADYDEAIKLGSGGCLLCAYMNRGHIHRRRGDNDEAIADFTQVIQLKPEFVNAYVGRAHAYTHEQDYEKAIADYTQAIKLKSTACLFNSRAIAYARKKEYDEAINDYNHAIKLEPKVPGFFINRGNAYARRGDHYRAIADYTQAIMLGYGSDEGFHIRGHAYEAVGDTDKALDDYSQAIKLNPDDPELYWHRAQINDTKDELGIAIALADYNKAIQLSPYSADYYYNRGKVYARRGDSDKAIADFTTSIQHSPDHPLPVIDHGKHFPDVRKAAQDALQQLGVATEQGMKTKRKDKRLK